MEPLNLMVSLSFFGNKRDRTDIATNPARRPAETSGETATAASRPRRLAYSRSRGTHASGGGRRAAGARLGQRLVQALRGGSRTRTVG
jgi:hypothetical protein